MAALILLGFKATLNQRSDSHEDREESDSAETEERDQKVVSSAGKSDTIGGHGRRSQNQHEKRGESGGQRQGGTTGNVHKEKSIATGGSNADETCERFVKVWSLRPVPLFRAPTLDVK